VVWNNRAGIAAGATRHLRLLLAGLLLAMGGCEPQARQAEDESNPLYNAPPYVVGAAEMALHRTLFVADLHADTLLMGRDLRVASARGHVDLPRLRQSGVRLQVFSAPTNYPDCAVGIGCQQEPNQVARLVAAQGWPIETWGSDKARALYQAAKLRTVAADPAAGLVLLERREQLADLLRAPAGRIGAVLGVEGAQAVGPDIAGVDALADAGVRVLGLAHFFDNRVAGSAHGARRHGLTPFGRAVIARAIARGMIVDLAHASEMTIADFLREFPGAAFMLSHTGIRRAGCDVHRNLSPETMRAIAEAGGLIGIGAWDEVLCLGARDDAHTYAQAMAATILLAVRLIDSGTSRRGVEHVALGSDFDGWVGVGFDARGWPLVTQALRREGMADDQIRRVMGGNVCRLLLRTLPGSGPAPSPALCD
jgi:membrane dipeptidase